MVPDNIVNMALWNSFIFKEPHVFVVLYVLRVWMSLFTERVAQEVVELLS